MNNNTLKVLAEQLPPLTPHEALVESNRCLFCYDAPCTHACPTHIDIPRFIKKISTSNLTGSARTIFESNLMGASCARVCPVQELCEGACVLNSETKPIAIGRLQRYAMDHAYNNAIRIFPPVQPTGFKVAVVGAGPAGLSCAGELAKRGHSVTLFEKREFGGGLSTYGIIVLREPVPVALAEVEMIVSLGVQLKTGVDVSLDTTILNGFDAVFIATGLGSTHLLGIPGEDLITDGLAFIEQSKMDLPDLEVGRNVLVIGAGNTAVDCATVAKRAGAEKVTMIYRRTEREMTAYEHEYDFVKKEGVDFEFLTQPVRVHFHDGRITGLECVRIRLGEPDASGRPAPHVIPESNFLIPADQVIKAIGQGRPTIASLLGVETERGLIRTTPALETSVPGIYAGGDCVRIKGSASTVMAAQDGKIAAASIHQQFLNAKSSEVTA